MTESKNGLPIVYVPSQAAWEAWLEENGAGSEGLWLKLAKKGAAVPSLSYAEALDSALCYGWIDSQKASYDGEFWLQRFTPRRAGSKWSQVNRDKIETLLAQGRMQPTGLREVELAQQDGRWQAAYAPQSTMAVPDDFQAALDAAPTAQHFFDTLSRAQRYAILFRIHDAKRAATREKRIQQVVAMLAEGKSP